MTQVKEVSVQRCGDEHPRVGRRRSVPNLVTRSRAGAPGGEEQDGGVRNVCRFT